MTKKLNDCCKEAVVKRDEEILEYLNKLFEANGEKGLKGKQKEDLPNGWYKVLRENRRNQISKIIKYVHEKKR